MPSLNDLWVELTRLRSLIGLGGTTLTGYLKGTGGGAYTTQAVPIPVTDGGTGLTASPITVPLGGTGVATLAANGVLYGAGTSAVLATAQGGANSVLTANAGAPSFTASPTVTNLSATGYVAATNTGGSAAATGDFRMPNNGQIAAGTTGGRLVIANLGAIVDTGTASLNVGGFAGAYNAMALVLSMENSVALYYLAGAAGLTVEMSDPSGIYTPTAGTGSRVNIYWSGSAYTLENRRGATWTFQVFLFGI